MAARTPRRAAPVDISLAPIVLVKGSEGLLVDRALDRLRRLAYEADPALERTDVTVASYQAGQLAAMTSPSLFGESRMLIIRDLETMNDAFAQDLMSYMKAPASDVWIFLVHPGGHARGKKVIDALTREKFPVIPADPLKHDSDKLALLRADARAAGRQVEPQALQALVDALGSDVRSMAAALAQLFSDVHGRVTVQDVHRYQAGRVEASAFDVVDAAVAGNSARALTLVRHAFLTGANAQMLVAALASKLRQMVQVHDSGGNYAQLRMSPWQVDNVRKQLRGWSDEALGRAICAVAVADEETKGLSRSPERAVEKAVIAVCQLSKARR